MNREAAARKIQAAWARKRAPKPSEFVNKFSNFDYALTKPVVTSTIISLDVLFHDLSTEPLPKGTKELLGYTATGQLPVVRKLQNRAGAPLGEANIDKVKRWAFTVEFKNPDSTAYISHVENGKMQISATGPYERVIRLLEKSYYPGIINAPIKIVKIDTRMYINRSINLDGLVAEISRRVPSSKTPKLQYEPELMPGAYVKWSDPSATLIIYTNGAILTLGLKSLADIGATSEILQQIFGKYLVDKFKVFKYGRGLWGERNFMPALNLPKPARKNLAKKRAQGANRYALAIEGWNNNREGFYVRPGANGKPRFYPLVANLKLVKPKMIRAYAEAGVPIPQRVKNIFGVTGAEAPAPKVEGRRAPNWTATKEGFYVKPGPGGRPYFYQVPKGLAASRKTVVAAYKKAGVAIPNSVRNLFNIPKTPNNGAGASANETGNWKKPTHWLNYDAKGVVRINGRQYDRYTRPELVQIARNIGIAEVSEKLSLAKIADVIAKYLEPYTNVPNTEINGVPVMLMANGRVKRGSRIRQWATLKPAEQNAIARGMLNSFKLEEYSKANKSAKFNYLMGAKRQMQEEARNEAVAGLANETTTSARSVSSTNSNFARNLEYTVMASELLGNTNAAQVNKFVALIKTLPKGARGRPLKPTIEKAARNFKRAQVTNAQLTNVRRAYAEAVRVPNWLPSNMHSAYKNHLVRLGTTPNAKGVLPTKEAVRRGMQAWLNASLPQGARAAYERENINTGLVVRVPAWNPANRGSPTIPNIGVKRVGPERKKRAPKPKPAARTNAPAVGPVKAAKKDPRENKNYPVPRTANAENLVNAIANLGLNIGPSNRYSWSYLANKGLNDRFYQNWMNYATSPNKSLTVNGAKAQLNSLKTAKARQEWLVARRTAFAPANYRNLVAYRTSLNQSNKNRRAAARAQA
jgi:TATA-box binding protein (TBP) (component of TFIID and TFIIIB)